MAQQSLDLLLITKLLEEEDASGLLSDGFSASCLVDEEARTIFRFIMRRYERTGRVPALEVIQHRFHGFEPESSNSVLADVAHELKARKCYGDTQKAIARISVAAEEDPEKGLEAFQEEAARLSARFSGNRAEDVTKSAAEVKRYYQMLKKGRGMLGIPWPWKCLDEVSGGISRGSFSAFYGAPGSFKTWILIAIADKAHREHGAKPVFFTFEMPVDDIRFRWACLRARADYKQVRAGNLSQAQEKRFFEATDEFAEDPPFFVEELSQRGPAAVSEIRGKLQARGSTLAILDGIKFVTKSPKWEDFDVATTSLRSVALQTRIPIIASHHTNRAKEQKGKDSDGTGADDVAYGESLFRDATVLIKLWRNKIMVEDGELGMTSRKVREGQGVSFVINAKPAYDFSQKHVFGDGDRNLGGIPPEGER